MRYQTGSLAPLLALIGAAIGLQYLSTRCVNVDYTPNPEARAIYESRGAPFDPVAGAPKVQGIATTIPKVPVMLTPTSTGVVPLRNEAPTTARRRLVGDARDRMLNVHAARISIPFY